MRYVRLDGTEFSGPMFHPQMEWVELEDGRTYETVFEAGVPIYRRELPEEGLRDGGDGLP